MRLLLDTHIFLWWLKADRRLSKKARSKITNANEVYISSASIWEMVIKMRLKKLDVQIEEAINAITASGFLELPVSAAHASALLKLPDIHKDPFDRILIAQAVFEPLTFLTADTVLENYSDLVEMV